MSIAEFKQLLVFLIFSKKLQKNVTFGIWFQTQAFAQLIPDSGILKNNCSFRQIETEFPSQVTIFKTVQFSLLLMDFFKFVASSNYFNKIWCHG